MQINPLFSFSGVRPQEARPQFGGLRPVIQTSRGDVVQFRGKALEPKFIAPMVLEDVPAVDLSNPENKRFYIDLIRKAQGFARAAVSNYRVGEVLVGKSGRAYLSTNIETRGDSTANTVHGEGFAISQARRYGEKEVTDLFLSGPPCGHCRQLLFETGNPELKIHIVDMKTEDVQTYRLKELFPVPFDSTGANAEKNLFLPSNPPLTTKPKSRSPLVQAAIDGAFTSYLPKPGRKAWGGAAVQLENGEILNGGLITVSGANPTISPMQEVLVKVAAAEHPYSAIKKAVIVEPENADYSYHQQSKAILASVSPGAKLRRVLLPQS